MDAYHPEQDNPKAPLWIGTHGGLNHRSSVTRMLEKYALQAGIEAVNPHALRHTFATRMFLANEKVNGWRLKKSTLWLV